MSITFKIFVFWRFALSFRYFKKETVFYPHPFWVASPVNKKTIVVFQTKLSHLHNQIKTGRLNSNLRFKLCAVCESFIGESFKMGKDRLSELQEKSKHVKQSDIDNLNAEEMKPLKKQDKDLTESQENFFDTMNTINTQIDTVSFVYIFDLLGKQK